MSSRLIPPLCCYTFPLAFPSAAPKASAAAHIIIIPQQPENTSPTNGFLIASLIFVLLRAFSFASGGQCAYKANGAYAAPPRPKGAKGGKRPPFRHVPVKRIRSTDGYSAVAPTAASRFGDPSGRRGAADVYLSLANEKEERKSSLSRKRGKGSSKNCLSDYCQSDVMTGCVYPLWCPSVGVVRHRCMSVPAPIPSLFIFSHRHRPIPGLFRYLHIYNAKVGEPVDTSPDRA